MHIILLVVDLEHAAGAASKHDLLDHLQRVSLEVYAKSELAHVQADLLE